MDSLIRHDPDTIDWMTNPVFRHAMIEELGYSAEVSYRMWTNRRFLERYWKMLNDKEKEAEMRPIGKDKMEAINDRNLAKLEIINDSIPDSLRIKESDDLKFLAWWHYREKLAWDRWELLFEYLQLDQEVYDPDIMKANISALYQHSTLQYLAFVYKDQMASCPWVSKHIRDRNYTLITERLAEMEEQEFVHYKSNDASRNLIKEVDFCMDNDVQMFVNSWNQDRDLTGGGALTVSTDYLKSRWVNPGWSLYLFRHLSGRPTAPKQMMMSYQSLSMGAQFHSPYIRYRDNVPLANALFQYDRPFASYVYASRDKYKLWSRGLIRYHSSLQVGNIGNNWGRDIQAMLHRDAIVSSQKVYGWDKQIAHGGRWLLQNNQALDFLLFSTSNSNKTIFIPSLENWHRAYPFRSFGLNVIGTSEAMIGGYLTAAGIGIKVSTCDFRANPGQKTLRAAFQRYPWNLMLEGGFRYRYVYHSSALEGFGYGATFKDDQYDDDAESVYTLNQAFYDEQNQDESHDKWTYDRVPADRDQVVRQLMFWDFRVNLQVRRMTLYWHMTVHTKEWREADKDNLVDFNSFEHLVKDEDKGFYRNTVVPELEEYRNRNWYGFGKVGATWLF